MISLHSKIKMFIIFSMITNIIIAISLFIINHFMGNQTQTVINPQFSIHTDRIFIFTIIIIIIGLIAGMYTLIFTYIRGLNRYKELSQRLHTLSNSVNFNLNTIEFPHEDEFGNIGAQFNIILSTLAKFDELKTQRIKMERQKFSLLAGLLDIPVLFIGLSGLEKIVKYYNNKFQELFTKKEDEDVYYLIEDTSLQALTSQCLPSSAKGFTPLIDTELLEAIDLAINVLSPSSLKRDFCSMSGKERYHCEKLDIIPIWDDHNQVGDILLLFNNMRKK